MKGLHHCFSPGNVWDNCAGRLSIAFSEPTFSFHLDKV